MMESGIGTRNVCKAYGKKSVLQDVTCQWQNGRIHGIVGRNGSGKTMLFKVITGYVLPDSGGVYVDGKRIHGADRLPVPVGVILDTPGFLPWYSGYRNLKQLADLTGRIGKTEILKAMEAVGLEGRLRKPVYTYSKGMKQRLAIAQAIMEDPELLILDEPMNGLDENGVVLIRELLLGLRQQGKTILLSSHNHEDIDTLCDTVCRMVDGVLTEERGFAHEDGTEN